MVLLQRYEPGSEIQCADSIDGAAALLREAGLKHLVLVDDAIVGVPGLAGLDRLVRAALGAPIGLIAHDRSRQTVLRALGLGAAGVLRPNFHGAGLYHTLRLIIVGET